MLLLGLDGGDGSFSQNGWRRRIVLLETVSGGFNMLYVYLLSLLCP